MADQIVSEFEIIDHGPESSQYFQGCGVAFTEFTDIATGAGFDRWEAYDDALEQLACGGWDIAILPEPQSVGKNARLPKEMRGEGSDCYWYVSVRVKSAEVTAE